jgi:hypothetical protein
MAEIRAEARFWCSPELSDSDECAASIRAKVAEIAALIEAAEQEQTKVKAKKWVWLRDDMGQLNDVMFVVGLLNRVLEAWPEYWDEQYMAEMAEED